MKFARSDGMERIAIHSPEPINTWIHEKTVKRLDKIGSDVHKINERLHELEEEWDIERAIETNSSALILGSLALGTIVNKKWFLLSALTGGYLWQHARKGWCRPAAVLRRLGFRTQREIESERAVLKARLATLPQAAHETLHLAK